MTRPELKLALATEEVRLLEEGPLVVGTNEKARKEPWEIEDERYRRSLDDRPSFDGLPLFGSEDVSSSG